MKKMSINVSWIVVAAALIGLGSAADARAGEEKLVAQVPFAFTVGDAHLPPGSYVVREATDDPGLLEIVNADGRDAAFAITIPAADRNLNGTSQPELVFVKRDGQYFLTRLVTDDGDDRDFVLRQRQDRREVSSGER